MLLVGPDNGLLMPAARASGGPARAVEIETPGTGPMSPAGATFDGRDVFAPAAARLCSGADLSELGPPVGVASLIDLNQERVAPQWHGSVLHCEVVWVDRYGNAQLNVGRADATRLGPRIEVRRGEELVPAEAASAFATIRPGTLGLVEDSYGLLALCLDGASAAETLGLAAGQHLSLRPALG